MATTGQTLNDRFNAVRYAIAGQGLARTVCKATTEEVLGPKKKHIEYLLACTNEPNVSIPQLANLLIERTQHTSWAVVFKSLTTIHHLMSYGDERFTQYLATSNHSFELTDFMDRTTPQGYNMSTFVRRYAKYINGKSVSYRTLAIDLCKIRSGNDNALRTMNMDNLSKTLPIVQMQFDALLEFAAESKDLNNGVIMSAFRLLYKDLVRLYVAYQEAIINLLERYFKLSRKKTREALVLYKNYLARMDKVADFLRVVDSVGLDKSEMPDLTKSPASILRLLEQHLGQLEAKKKGGAVSPAGGEEVEGEGADGDEKGAGDKEKIASSSGGASKASGGDSAESAGRSSPSPLAAPQGPSGEADTAGTAPAPAPATVPSPAPPKPARPSPKSSPKVSPTTHKPPPPASLSSAPKPTAAPSAAPAAAPEKKGPPERPAKPPSRPPPPSGSTNPGQPSSTAVPTPAAAAGQTSSAPKTESAGSAVAHTPPPPHPPPPSSENLHHHQTSNPNPSTATTAEAPAPACPAQQQVDADATVAVERDEPTTGAREAAHAAQETSSAPSNGQSNHDEPPSVTCSSAGATVSPEAEVEVINRMDNMSNGEQTVETNHVNGANSLSDQHQVLVDEIQMPPPPPPIEDMDEPPPPEQQQPVEPAEGEANVEAVADVQGLIVNGDDARSGE